MRIRGKVNRRKIVETSAMLAVFVHVSSLRTTASRAWQIINYNTPRGGRAAIAAQSSRKTAFSRTAKKAQSYL